MKSNVSASSMQGDSCNRCGKEKLPNKQIEKGLGDKPQYPRPTLNSLMAAYSGPKPAEIDIGEAKGSEIW